ncbi:MAG: PilT/PilU family type 4a pilus ATPase [bacterium]
MFHINDLLRQAVAVEASDIHLKVGQHPCLRLHGALAPTDLPVLTADDLEQTIRMILPPHLHKSYEEQHEADFSHTVEGGVRFRVNAFLSQGAPALAFRHVKTQVPTVQELNLPESITKIAGTQRGIVIISGTTGSGKSTTLAAMLNHINETKSLRVISIEDPIEYLFTDKQSIISQREVGLDTLTFQAALKHVLRQDPDVIVIGEMRDQTTFRTALAAAETGHLVLTTLHSGNAAVAVQRLLEFFPSGEWDQVRLNLASNLQAVICQRLVKGSQGGVIPAVEILINTPTVRKVLEKNKLEILPAAIETGVEDGMQTFNQSIYQLIKSGMISQDEGMQNASNPQALRMNLQGIFLDESRRILSAI